MPKVFNEIDLIKRLLDESDTMRGFIHYKEVSVKKDHIHILFQMNVDLSLRDKFMKFEEKAIPYIILNSKQKIQDIIKEIEFEKEENVNAKLQG